MVWKTTNALGKEVVWYSPEDIKELLKKIDILEENTKFVKSKKYGFYYEKDIDNLVESKLETINQSCKNYKEAQSLKAENNYLKSKVAHYELLLKQGVEHICTAAEAEEHAEYLKKQAIVLYIEENHKLKTTLTEIKKIVECSCFLNCGKCPMDKKCKNYCDRDFNLQDIIYQIISEVEHEQRTTSTSN